ncbi:hypothetical protein [Roseobacter ponti]|uniref:Lipoprotein n=1 Tax=Roseobacter ponti TaxID=1891787 RepID=A0A858SNB1_9RHOB|nr:hypothetical protein [Roseobacter ponti]QJF50165.1 hypothetical protein G3256_02780 [Roseobacter ponti]
MKKKTLLALIAGSVLLMGCADTGQYPVTRNTVGVDDQVRFMTAPNLTRY